MDLKKEDPPKIGGRGIFWLGMVVMVCIAGGLAPGLAIPLVIIVGVIGAIIYFVGEVLDAREDKDKV